MVIQNICNCWKCSPDGQFRDAESQGPGREPPLSEVPPGAENNPIDIHIVNLSVWFLLLFKAIDAYLPLHHTYMTLLMSPQLNSNSF